VTDITVIVVCAECGLYWPVDAEQPPCSRAGHVHQQHELHRHRTDVALPGDTTVTAVSFDERDPYSREAPPAFGLYLDARWQPPWPHRIIAWPDFGVPDDRAELEAALQDLLDRARNGQRVEIGCLGAHGRTGTALAYLVVLCGHPAADAVDWVRAHYCSHAVETDEQAAFIAALNA